MKRTPAVMAAVLFAFFGATGARADRILRGEVIVAAPVDEVWRAWTTPEGIGWGEGEDWDRAYEYFDRAWGDTRAAAPRPSLRAGPDRLAARPGPPRDRFHAAGAGRHPALASPSLRAPSA